MDVLTRRDFFTGRFKALKRMADNVVEGSTVSSGAPSYSRAELEAIAGDFPPELLSLEAERLGMDPDSPDRETLLSAVLDAMAGNAGPEQSGR